MPTARATSATASRTRGRQLDAETGLYYYRNRHYHAQLGGFISRDPIDYTAGDPNLYRYVQSNPASLLDPSGYQIGNPGSGDSISRSIWDKMAKGDFEGALDLLDDVANNIDPNLVRQLRSAVKQAQNLDKWRKQVSKLKQKDLADQIKNLEKTLAKHLKKRKGCHMPETWRIQYQIDFLKNLLK
jgi:RHS repeat-associated protein